MNAMLNYAYGMLKSQLRIAIAEARLDSTIGHLHVCQLGRDSFIYDLMEPFRPQANRVMLAFVRSKTFSPRDFLVDGNGVCKLHPELARRCVALQAHYFAAPARQIMLEAESIIRIE